MGSVESIREPAITTKVKEPHSVWLGEVVLDYEPLLHVVDHASFSRADDEIP